MSRKRKTTTGLTVRKVTKTNGEVHLQFGLNLPADFCEGLVGNEEYTVSKLKGGGFCFTPTTSPSAMTCKAPEERRQG